MGMAIKQHRVIVPSCVRISNAMKGRRKALRAMRRKTSIALCCRCVMKQVCVVPLAIITAVN